MSESEGILKRNLQNLLVNIKMLISFSHFLYPLKHTTMFETWLVDCPFD